VDLLGPGVVKRLKRLALHSPGLALGAAASAGTLLGPGSRWAGTPAEIADVLGVREPRAVRAIQRRMAANALRSLALGAIHNRRGLAASADRVHVVGAERLLALRERGIPVVVVTAHVGVGNTGVFDLLGVPARAAALQRAPAGTAQIHFEAVYTPVQAARFLRNAAADLAQGVVPLLPFDGASDGNLAISFLGRQLGVGRGLLFLAMRGARLLPLTNRWLGSSGRIEVTLHPPFPELDAQASREEQRALAETIGRWFEDYVRRDPGELSVWKLRELHAAKPA
jgi:lauroyl/myristoyl acyltransferase